MYAKGLQLLCFFPSRDSFRRQEIGFISTSHTQNTLGKNLNKLLSCIWMKFKMAWHFLENTAIDILSFLPGKALWPKQFPQVMEQYLGYLCPLSFLKSCHCLGAFFWSAASCTGLNPSAANWVQTRTPFECWVTASGSPRVCYPLRYPNPAELRDGIVMNNSYLYLEDSNQS